MSVRWYSLGVCAGCGKPVVRRHSFRGDVGYTLSSVCFCSPKLEVMKGMVAEDGRLFIWDEIAI